MKKLTSIWSRLRYDANDWTISAVRFIFEEYIHIVSFSNATQVNEKSLNDLMVIFQKFWPSVFTGVFWGTIKFWLNHKSS